MPDKPKFDPVEVDAIAALFESVAGFDSENSDQPPSAEEEPRAPEESAAGPATASGPVPEPEPEPEPRPATAAPNSIDAPPHGHWVAGSFLKNFNWRNDPAVVERWAAKLAAESSPATSEPPAGDSLRVGRMMSDFAWD